MRKYCDREESYLDILANVNVLSPPENKKLEFGVPFASVSLCTYRPMSLCMYGWMDG
jgi:hypothetical protein